MSRSRPAPRRRSRQVALQVLYAIDLGEVSEESARPSVDQAFALVAENFELPQGAHDFACELVHGIVRHRPEIDALLADHATNWRISRMAAVDRNILRIGAYELIHTDTPAQVVLDEAIELARRYGNDPSPAFVNGVLDAVGRAVTGVLRGGAPAEPGGGEGPG
ncbi:MAG: transcription antitermination factor NusB [Myxococcota bacterium]